MNITRICGNCITAAAEIPDGCINLVVTSPPYAEQRKSAYGGIPEEEYPAWTVQWMAALAAKLTPDGSICINFKAGVKNGVLRDWELETIATIKECGWKHCGTIPWIKPDSPPLGSTKRPREAWEPVYWFSLTGNPACYPKNGGKPSNRIGFENNKFSHGGDSHIHAGQNDAGQGIARVPNYIMAGTSKIENGYKHPAMFPPEIPAYFIRLLTQPGDIVCDPFEGSGTTGRAALALGRRYIGIEKDKVYFDLWNPEEAAYGTQ